MAYKIAEHLPLAARQAATAATYDHCVDQSPLRSRFPRTATGQCPLAVALLAAGYCQPIEAPSAREVVGCLRDNGDTTPYHTLYNRAQSFILSWDWGGVTDLAAALGVQP